MSDYDTAGEAARERAYDREMDALNEAAADATDPLPDPDGVEVRFGCDQDAEGETPQQSAPETCLECGGSRKVCPATYGGACHVGNNDLSCQNCIKRYGIECRACHGTGVK